jgi:hypothetical protein
MKRIYRLVILTLFLFSISCDLDNDLDNPNEIGLENADVDQLMNKAQLELASFFAKASGGDNVLTTGVDVLVRMNAMIVGDTYDRSFPPQQLDDTWEKAYQGVLINIKTLLPLAQEDNLTTHIAAAKIMEAYVYLTLVDIFGDVPQSQALRGEEKIFNPTADSGSDIYAYAISLLDEARTELAKTGSAAGNPLARDVFYNGNRKKWAALANTLELKARLNESALPAREATAKARISELLQTDLIDTDAEEFTYKYGTADSPARSRHPHYLQYYRPEAGAAGGYIGNYFLKQSYNGKGVQDPRWRYYFYRQVGSISRALAFDGESVPCVASSKPEHYTSKDPFCVFEPGFFGRDHANNDGIPPDGPVMTCVGVYPAGGRVDDNTNSNYFDPAQRGEGGNGAGIEPIFMAFFTDFMKAEAALRLGTEGDPRELLQSGINKSIKRVRDFAVSLDQALPAGLEPSSIAYVNAVLTLYDAPGANKLDVVGKEFYLSLWGNGIEAYNLYRRTGTPADLQPTLAVNSGKFFRSLIYPATFVNLNTSVEQKNANDIRVFWDGLAQELK